MSFRCDTAVHRTRKLKRCEWCSELIPSGSAAVTISGVYEGDFSCIKLHPECWRAEHYEFWDQKHRPEEWPDYGMMHRGTIVDRDDIVGPETKVWSAVPVTKDEIRGQIRIE